MPEGWLSDVLSAEYTAKFDEAPQKSIVNWQDESNAAEKHCESDSSGDDDDAAAVDEVNAPAPVVESVASSRPKRSKAKHFSDMVRQQSSSEDEDEDNQNNSFE